MKFLIKNGRVVLPDSVSDVDVLVEDGKIARLEKGLPEDGARVIDAEGKIVFPGFIDPHTHMYLVAGSKNNPIPTSDDFESGTLAAVCGGTTTIIDHATQDKGMSLPETVRHWHELADGKSSCNYGFHMGIADWNEQTKEDIKLMPEEGITSFKVYLAYNNLKLEDNEIYEIIKAADKFGGIVTAHCENGRLVNELIAENLKAGNISPAFHQKSRPDYVEGEAVERFLTIGEAADAPVYVVHLSTKRGLEACRRARERGQELYIESCPQYYYLTDDLYGLDGFESAKYVFAPPARGQGDIEALSEALAGGEIDTIGSDQCAFNFKGAKERGRDNFSKIPNGIPGAELRPALMFSKANPESDEDLVDFSKVMSTNSAKIFGMYPQKGTLEVGSDADIVIWDPDEEFTVQNELLHHNVDYSPYEGVRLKGKADTVLLNGDIVVERGQPVKTKQGKFVKRKERIN